MIYCSTAFAQDFDLLWKARALKASENLEKLAESMKKDNSQKITLEIMVESAYAAIIAMPEITVKKTPKIIVYHFILNYGNDGILDVGYTYDIKTNEYLGVRIDRIPKNRGVLMMTGNQFGNFFALSNNIDVKEPMILFSKSDPFKTVVMDSK